MRLKTSMVFATVLFLAHARGAGAQEIHPQDRYRVHPHDTPYSVLSEQDDLPPHLQRVAESLRRIRLVARIGVQDAGPLTETLGEIAGVELGHDGRLYVLDASFQTVRVFALDGAFVATFGRPGQGPGEFIRARGLAIDPFANSLYVADAGRKLHRFALLADGGAPELSGTTQLELAAEQICLLDDTVFAYSMRFAEGRPDERRHTGPPNVLHSVSAEGRTLSSFGAFYNSPSTIANLTSSWAHLACDKNTRTLFVTTEAVLGETHAFDTNGERKWIVGYKPFRALRQTVTRAPRERLSQAIPDDGFHRVKSTTVLPGEGLLVRVELLEASNDEPSVTATTHFLLDADGTGGAIDLELGAVVAASSSHVVTMAGLPNPVLSIFERPGRKH